MIKLENVSIDNLSLWIYAPKIKKIVDEFELKSIQDLLDEIQRSPEIDWSNIEKKLNCLIKEVDKNNKKEKEPIIFNTTNYEDSTLKYTDTLNNGNILLLSSPTTENAVTYYGIKDKSIDNIKNNLLLTQPDGSNYLISYTRNISLSNIQKLIDAINMYNEQVVRQSMLTDSRDFNVFTYEQEEKKEIVRDNYADIITYLVYNTNEFVWGKVSDLQKKRYISSIINNNKIDNIIRDRMINNIANYTTLKELENYQKDNYKLLKRFIKS